MREAIEVLLLSLLLAALLTVQVYIFLGLVFRRRRIRALTSLAFPPLAPYWSWQEGMRGRSVLWLVLAVAYATLLSFVLIRG